MICLVWGDDISILIFLLDPVVKSSKHESHIIFRRREKTDGKISLQYLNGAEGESQPGLVMF